MSISLSEIFTIFDNQSVNRGVIFLNKKYFLNVKILIYQGIPKIVKELPVGKQFHGMIFAY